MKKLIILTIILFTVQFLAPISAQTEQKPELVVQTGHIFPVNSVVFSPNGKLVASGSGDKTIKLWDVATRKELRTFEGHSGSIYSSKFSPDGKMLASGSSDATIKLWDVQTGNELKTFKGHSSPVMSIAFSHDGKTLASGSEDTTIKLWDVINGNELATLHGHIEFVLSVAFSPDGKSLASAGGYAIFSDSIIKLWDVKSRKELRTIQGHNQKKVNSVSFSKNSQVLVSGGSDATIKFWDVATGKELKMLSGFISAVNSVAFSYDGKILGSVNSNIIKLWDVATGRQLRTFTSQTHSFIESFAFSPDGKTLIFAGGENKTIELLDVVGGKEIESFKGVADSVSKVAFSLDGKMVASINDSNIIKLWGLEPNIELKNLVGHSDVILSIAFSPDCKTLASGSSDRTIKLWDVKTASLIRTLTGFYSSIWSVKFSPDGKILASGGGLLGSSQLWDVATGKELATFEGHSLPVNLVAFSPNGNILATGGLDMSIKLWNIKTGREIITLKGHNSTIYSIVFSSDGKSLASTSYDKIFKFWDIESGKELRSFSLDNSTGKAEVSKILPEFFKKNDAEPTNADGKLQLKIAANGKINLIELTTERILVSLIRLNEQDWIITTPDGRFDTNKLENPKGLNWVMPDAPFTPLSFEVFMRDYYEPNLLPRLLKCTEENNCETEFKPVRNLTELNRTQPKVRIAEIKATNAADVVQVTVEAEDVASEYQKDKQNKPLHSGAADLRLFRDGQLVGYAPDGEGAVTLTGQGKFTKTFSVRLPKNTNAKEFNFTAYAFNSDRVKSETTSQIYTLPKPLPTAKGSAYIVTIGVNANEDRRYDLRYAVNDARKLQKELAKRLPKDKYEQIVQIPLISDYGKDGKLNENNATKAKIKAVLEKLAGKTVADDVLKDVPNAASLKKVQPEDLVLIAFSGHGYADREGIFYLVPYDIGASASGGLAGVLQKSISSDELSLWLRDIDAGEMMMIVDACHSAAAVQGKDFKPGPMGSRGLGQLSYDKGMRILTATQADNVALELRNLQHGLLTYSLVKNGIELGFADFQPKDNKLFSNEWLGYAVKDVPLLYEKILNGEIKGLLINGVKPKSDVFYLDEQKSNLNLQQPSLFDFSRRDRQFEFLNMVLIEKKTGN